jgi:biotin transport system substrate-specific component
MKYNSGEMTLASPSLVQVLATRNESRTLARATAAAAVVFIAALTAAAAQFSVTLPFTAVPLTFQPTVVLLGGLVLGARLGMASQVLYLAAGIAGLPVFAPSLVLPPGALRLLGPTGGYLMAYPFAAFAVGYLAQRGFDRRYATSVLAMLAGLAIVYACGATWFGVFARTGAESVSTGLQRALAGGVYPFVLADIGKLMIAAAILPTLWRIVGRRTNA